MKRWIPWITGFAIVGALLWSFVYLKKLHPLGSLETNLGKNNMNNYAIQFVDSKLVGRANGQKAWQFNAATVDLNKDRRTAVFKDIRKGSLLQNGKEIASLSAKEVAYNTITRNLTVPGEAQISMTGGPTIRVRNASWFSNESRLVCTGGIDASLAGSTMQGEGMTADLAKKELTITKVKGIIKL